MNRYTHSVTDIGVIARMLMRSTVAYTRILRRSRDGWLRSVRDNTRDRQRGSRVLAQRYGRECEGGYEEFDSGNHGKGKVTVSDKG